MGRGRLRDLGITTGLLPTGKWNAITDVPGVKVGVATLITETPHVVRTGVTSVSSWIASRWSAPPTSSGRTRDCRHKKTVG